MTEGLLEGTALVKQFCVIHSGQAPVQGQKRARIQREIAIGQKRAEDTNDLQLTFYS